MANHAASFSGAFPELFPRAVRIAHRILGDRSAAEDAAAEAMARAYAHWDRLVDPAHRTAWVLRVATNLAIDAARRRDPTPPPPLATADAQETVAARLTLVEALRTLPTRQREAVVLRHLGGLSQADVAAALGVSPGTVTRHVHRGLRALRVLLAEPTLEMITTGGTVQVHSLNEALSLVDTDTVVTAHVLSVEGPATWNVDIGVRALLRRRQHATGALPDLVGRDVDCVVLQVDPDRGLAVTAPPLSQDERDVYRRRAEQIGALRPGDVRLARVRSAVPFGVFVQVGEVYGLVHKSELGDHEPAVGQTVGVEVLETDVALQRMSLRLAEAVAFS